MNRTWWYVIGAALVMILDRITKCLALASCVERCTINQILAFEVGYNRGVTWGLLYSHNSIVFVLVSGMIMAITAGVAWYAYEQYKEGHNFIGETLVVAGSVSNIIDRFWYGGVVDFIEFSYGTWIWPSFNIADMCIVFGIAIMLISHIKKGD
jgi:signal peptidase II